MLLIFLFLIISAFLRIKGLPFNCEASQFQDYPIHLCNGNEYGFYRSALSKGYGYDKKDCVNCKHFKICHHKKGESDCKTENKYDNRGYVSSEGKDAKCPKALIMQDFNHPTEDRRVFQTFSSLDTQCEPGYQNPQNFEQVHYE